MKDTRFWGAALLCLAGILCISERAPAQPPPTSPEKIQESAADSGNASDVRTIYVPFANLAKVFEKPETNVVLTYEEYQQLLETWRKAQRPPQTPDAVITSADYVLTIDGELARISATFKVQVMESQGAQLPVSFGTATIGRFTAPEGILLRGLANGGNVLVFPKPGEFSLELELASPVHQSPDAREISFSIPPVALTTLDVTVPGEKQRIEILPRGLTIPDAAPPAEVTHRRVNVGATDNLTIRWRPAESQMPAMELLASVNNRTLVTLADGLIHTETWLGYDILRGQLNQARIVVPKGMHVRDVLGDRAITSWTVEENDHQQIVTVKLAQPANQSLLLTLHAESPLNESEFPVIGTPEEGPASGIHALDVVRESGQIAVRHAPDLMVNILEQQGLLRIENSAADPKLAGSNAMLFKFYSPRVNLRLSARPIEPRIDVKHAVELLVREEELQFSNTLAYHIERAGVFELLLKLPEEIIVDDVQCPQMKEYSVNADSGQMTVSLRERTQGDLQLSIKGRRRLTGQMTQDFSLPILEPLNVDQETGQILVYTRESIEVQVTQTEVENVQPLPLTGHRRQGDLVLSSGWTFNRRPVVIPVKIVRKPTRLSAQVGTVIDVQPELVQVSTEVEFHVEYSGMDTFRLSVPEAISQRLQIQLKPGDTTSAPIKQKTAADPQDGRVIWTILTQREVIGHQQFLLTCDLPGAETSDEENSSEPQQYSLALIRPLGSVNDDGEVITPITHLRGEVSLKKDRTLSVSAEVDGEGIERIDIRELQFLPRTGTLAFRYFRDDAENPLSVTVTSERFEIQNVVTTVVSRGLVEIVTSEDQNATYRCRFRVKSSERQRLLIALPKDLEILGAFLNDREIKLEKADVSLPSEISQALTPFWINIARPQSSDVPFLITLQFLWNLNSGENENLLEEGLMQMPLPVIAGGGDGVLQELKVVIWMPEDYALIGDPKPFLLEKQQRPWSFLLGTPAKRQTSPLEPWVTQNGRTPVSFAELPTEGRDPYIYSTLGEASQITVRVWNKLAMTLLVSITLVLIGWILLSTSWENKLGILLIMAFAAAMYGLSDSHGLYQGLRAARFGLAVMLGLWLLRGLLGRPSRTAPKIPRDYEPVEIPYAVVPPPGVFDELKPEPGDASS